MDKGRHTYESEPTSGFTKPADFVNSSEFTEFTSIPSSGVFQLTRAKRQGRWWVLKGLKEEYREDSVYRALLQKEYEITVQLQHPMVVSAFALEEVADYGLCIVMEWIDGMTLKEWERKRPRPQKRQRRHVADMLMEVLAYVHSRQTQHRDLKPSNIMLTYNGQHLKLIDFGLSDTDSHAILKAPAGTEGYMAPEGPSDIYSLWLHPPRAAHGVVVADGRPQVLRTTKASLHQRGSRPKRPASLLAVDPMDAPHCLPPNTNGSNLSPTTHLPFLSSHPSLLTPHPRRNHHLCR